MSVLLLVSLAVPTVPAIAATWQHADSSAEQAVTPHAKGGRQGKGPNAKPTQKPRPNATPTPTPAPTSTATPAPAPTPTPTAAPTATPPPSSTAGHYVSPTGSDTNPGTYSQPWRTLGHAVAAAPAGATVSIRGGTYAPVQISRSWLTLQAYGSEAVYVNATSTIPNAIRISSATGITIRGLTLQNGPNKWGSGIRIERSWNVSVLNSVLRNNRSFGAMIENSWSVNLENNVISENETGVQVSYDGWEVVIRNNTIRDNNRMITNDSTAWNDRGANGIVLYKTTGTTRILGNTIHGNRAPSIDYGYDGGAVEIFAAKNVEISGNTMYNNQNVVETGTDGSTGCSGIKFTRNVAYGGPDGGLPSQGLILRCIANSLVANNTLSDLSDFVFYVTETGGFAGSLTGLTIKNNLASQPATKVYSFQNLPAGLTIDHDLVHNAAGGSIAWVNGKGNTNSLDTFRSWTGYQRNGVQGDPRLTSTFRLSLGSPAVDRGTIISGITDGFLGLAPDIGRYEY